MELILAILIYLNVLISPGTYTQSQIDDLIRIHEIEINNVQADPNQMNIVEQEYLYRVNDIIIINETELD